MMVHRVPLSWFKLHLLLLLLRVRTRARTFWPLRMLLLLPSALYLVLCQAIVVANAQLLDPLDEIELPPPPPPPPEGEAWPDAEGPLTAETPATAVLVMTALRLVPLVTGLNSFLVLLILAIFVAALIFLLVFHVTLNWRPFQKGGRTGSVKADSALTTTGESSDCQLTPATPTASSHLPSDRTSKSHTHPHPSVPVDATTSSRLPCVCFPPFCCCYSPCDFCCLPPPRQPVTTTTSAGMTACSHFSPTPSRDTKEADSVTTFFHQEHTTTTTNGSDTQITASAPATPPGGGGGGCDNRFAGGEISSLPTSPSPQPVAAGALSQRRMISVPSLSQLPQVGQPEHVQPLCFDGRQLAAALPTGDISGRSLTSAVGATSGVLHLRSAAVCVIPQQREAASAPRTPLCAQPAVVGLHRLSTISASLSDVASASATAPTAELSTDSKAVLGRSADEVDAAGRWHPKATPSSLQSSANSVAADSASHDAFKRTTITATGTSRTPKRSLLESRRGSHTSLTLVLSPIIDSPHAAPQPSMSNPHGSQGSASFMGARGHRTNRFSPMAATTSPVSLHRPYGDEDSAALFSPEDRSHLHPRLRQPQQQQQQQRDHPGSSSSSSHQGASEGFNTAAGTTADHEILCQSSLPLTGQQLEKKLREDVASLFSEFWSIPTNLASRNKCGLAGVGQKNRYAGIIPNNETRVILPQTNNDELTTYINANYIHGYAGVPRAFIATQGPMTHTVNDFWRMIWHTRAPAIVMLTRLVESGKVKCEFYLPDSKFEAPTERSGPGRADTVPGGTAAGSRSGGASSADPPTATAALFLKSANSFPSQRGGGARKFVGRTGATDEEETDLSRTCARAGSQQMFGSVLVRVDSVVLKAGYTKRFITLKQGDEEHKVTHFWYVAWPDHSSPEATPTAARHLLHLVHETEACRYARAGASGGHCIPQSLSSPSTPPVATGSPPPTLPVHPPSRRFQRQHAEERTDAEVVDLLSEEEEATDFYGRGYRASDPLAVATGPVVVHCSAGIGRTGCFIALCIGCEQLRREDKVDVFGIVNRLRLDRGGMVEDHSQYAFLHIALATFNSLQRGLAPPEFPVMDLSLGFPRPGR